MTRRQGAASESRPSRSHEAGWTLIELLVVISLIMVLAAMGLAQYRNSVTSAKEAVLKADLFRMREALDQYYADNGQYPSGQDALVSHGWWRGQHGIARGNDSYGTTTALFAELHLVLESGHVVLVPTDATWRSTQSHILGAGPSRRPPTSPRPCTAPHLGFPPRCTGRRQTRARSPHPGGARPRGPR